MAAEFRFDDADSGRYSASSSSCVSPTFPMNQFNHPRSSTPNKVTTNNIRPTDAALYNGGPASPLMDSMFQRGGSITRSMFERKPSERRIKLRQKLDNFDEIQARRMSLDIREAALNEAADEAIKQVEQILKLREVCSDLQEENKFLKSEVETLREAINEQENEIDEKDSELIELREYRKELQEQLERSRRKLAQYRLQTEKIKVEHSVLSNSMSNLAEAVADDTEEELQQLRHEREVANQELQEARRRIEELMRENENIRRSMRLVKQREAVEDERSKEELLRLIRKAVEDKMIWEQYAGKLVGKIIVEAPHILDCNSRNVDAAAHCCHVESGWENYALLLQKTLLEHSPSLANSLLDKDPRHKTQHHRQPAPAAKKNPPPPPPPQYTQYQLNTSNRSRGQNSSARYATSNV